MPRSRPCRRDRRRRPPGTRPRRGRARPSTARGRRGGSPRGRAGRASSSGMSAKVTPGVLAHPLGILGDVVVEARVPVGQRALGVREDPRRRRPRPSECERRVAVRARGSRPTPTPTGRRSRGAGTRGSRARGSRSSARRAGRPRSSTRPGSRPRRPSAPAASRSRRAASHSAMTEARVSMRCPVGPPMPTPPGLVVGVDVHAGDADSRPARTDAAVAASPRRARWPRSRHPSRVQRAVGAGPHVDARGIETHGCTRQKSPRVSGSSATMTSSTSSRSAIVRVCGTTTSIVGTSGQLPRTEMTPREGVYAQSALFEAGAAAARPRLLAEPERREATRRSRCPSRSTTPIRTRAVRYSALYGLSARP